MFQHVLETTFILISAADKRSLATQRRRSGGAAQLIRDLWRRSGGAAAAQRS
ncbi:MAG: hypothetical protein ACRC0J_11335 [Shewanella oncorhynchi]